MYIASTRLEGTALAVAGAPKLLASAPHAYPDNKYKFTLFHLFLLCATCLWYAEVQLEIVRICARMFRNAAMQQMHHVSAPHICVQSVEKPYGDVQQGRRPALITAHAGPSPPESGLALRMPAR
ncbi:hypothetical protein BKA62DRAFT_675317 [Auriculariales sp. MPI-PUGE-AT-0066]|nr:hypothetical protein BKA62DRAFT_675317 [Auriculariales sp. MPI-PUGE-AT-0066]